MDGDHNACCSAESRERQVSQLRRAIDYDEIIVVVDGLKRAIYAVEEALTLLLVLESHWHFVLKLHQLEICRDDIQALDIGWPDDVLERNPLIGITDISVKGLVLEDVKLRMEAVNSREARLRIQINSQNPIAVDR